MADSERCGGRLHMGQKGDRQSSGVFSRGSYIFAPPTNAHLM